MKTLLRKCFALAIILGAIVAFVLGMLYVSHEMKPKRSDYQQIVADSGAVKKIYLVNNGWHTDVVLRMEDIPSAALPEKRLFNGQKYLVIGWGDAGFYQAKHITSELAAKALLKPTETVVHMAGFKDPPTKVFPTLDVISLHISKRGFDKMIEMIGRSVLRYSMLAAKPLRQGFSEHSHFFRGMGRYHFFNTCNHWTARMLKAAELPLSLIHI